MRTCSKCNQSKALHEFYKHPTASLGRDTVCATCKREYSKKYRKKNPEKIKSDYIKFRNKYIGETNGYAVYYLPEEHYVGFTHNIRQRMSGHAKKGRSTAGLEILCVCERPIDAHFIETLFHMRGYNGFQHKYIAH